MQTQFIPVLKTVHIIKPDDRPKSINYFARGQSYCGNNLEKMISPNEYKNAQKMFNLQGCDECESLEETANFDPWGHV